MATGAIAGITAAWTAIGSIGGGIIGGMIQGAIIGAVVGGLSSAITGGSIGQGILFGAVGGAVLGGVSGYMGSIGTTGASSAVGSTPVVSSAGWESVVAQGGEVVGSSGGATVGGASATSQSIAGTLADWGGSLVKEHGAAFAKGIFDSYAAGAAADDAHEKAMEMSALQHQQALERQAAAGSSGGGGGGAPDHAIQLKKMDIAQRQEELAAQTEKYQLDRSDRLAQEGEIRSMRQDRQALFNVGSQRATASKTDTGGESIQAMRGEQDIEQTALQTNTEEEETV